MLAHDDFYIPKIPFHQMFVRPRSNSLLTCTDLKLCALPCLLPMRFEEKEQQSVTRSSCNLKRSAIFKDEFSSHVNRCIKSERRIIDSDVQVPKSICPVSATIKLLE